MKETVTSAANPKIKELLALQEKSRGRREKGLFVVEGLREAGRCMDAGYVPRTLFICTELLKGVTAEEIERKAMKNNPRCGIIYVTPAVYARIAAREGTEGVTAEMYCRPNRLEDITLRDNPLVAVLESVEKPGNIGAVLRSADAAGADAVIICDPLTDLYNPNLIRASVGAVFSMQVAVADSRDAIAWLKANGIRILTAQLQDSRPYYECDMTAGTAIVMGTESTGLTEIWRRAADSRIRIPMLGALDSLNVSVSAAVLMFEAVRQRLGKK